MAKINSAMCKMISAMCVWMLIPAWAATPLHLLQRVTKQETTRNYGATMESSEALTFIEGLAERVVGHNYTLTEEEKSAIVAIEKFIDRILSDIVIQRNEDQAEVDGHHTLIGGCATTAITELGEVNNLNQSVNSSRHLHSECRIAQGRDIDDETDACRKYNDHRKTGKAPPTCMTSLTSAKLSTDDATIKQAMESCLEEINEWFPSLWDLYVKCRDSKDTVINKTKECNDKQEDFEGDFCQYSLRLSTVCDTQANCRSTNIHERSKSHAAVKISEEARATDCAVGHKVKCLLGIFNETNNTKKPSMLAACKVANYTCPDGITYPPIPDPTPCTKEPSEPCDAVWLQTEYTSKSWYSKAPAGPCTQCLRPPVTTTAPPVSTVFSCEFDGGSACGGVLGGSSGGGFPKFQGGQLYLIQGNCPTDRSNFIAVANDVATTAFTATWTGKLTGGNGFVLNYGPRCTATDIPSWRAAPVYSAVCHDFKGLHVQFRRWVNRVIVWLDGVQVKSVPQTIAVRQDGVEHKVTVDQDKRLTVVYNGQTVFESEQLGSAYAPTDSWSYIVGFGNGGGKGDVFLDALHISKP